METKYKVGDRMIHGNRVESVVGILLRGDNKVQYQLSDDSLWYAEDEIVPYSDRGFKASRLRDLKSKLNWQRQRVTLYRAELRKAESSVTKLRKELKHLRGK